MDNPEKLVLPLSIVASVIAIWAFLRKTPTQALVSQPYSGGNLTLPPVPPLSSSIYYPGESPGGGYGTDPAVVSAASSDPYNFTINVPINLTNNPWAGTYPPKLVENLPPWKNGRWAAFLQSLLQAGVPASDISTGSHGKPPSNGSAGGCGGKCGGGCGGSSNGCSAPRTQNKMPDGSGACYGPLYNGAPAAPPQLTILGYSVETSYPLANPQAAPPDYLNDIQPYSQHGAAA